MFISWIIRPCRGPWTSIKTFSADLRGPCNLVETGRKENTNEVVEDHLLLYIQYL